MKKLITSILLLCAAATANAQFAPGAVLKASDLNAALAAPTITGGSINNAPIGQSTPTTGRFTTLQIGSGASSFNADGSIGLAAGTKLGLSSTTAFGNNFVRYNSANNGLQLDSAGATVFTRGASNTESARFDANGNLGIGVTAPATSLHVGGSGITVQNSVANTFSQWVGGASDAGISMGSNASLVAYINGYNKAYSSTRDIAIQANGGNVGIGTSTAGARLDVLSGATSLNTLFESTASTTELALSASGTTTSPRLGTQTNDLYWKTGGVERMRLNSAGQLGLNTTAPDQKLTIASGSDSTGANDGVSFYGSSTNKQAAILSYNAGGFNGDLRFFTKTAGTASTTVTEAMRIDPFGNIGVGVTPSLWGSTYKAADIRTGSVYDTPTGTASGFSFNTYYNGANWIYKGTGGNAAATRYEQDAFGRHIWYSAPSGAGGATATFTQAMALDGSGKLTVASGSMNLGAQKTPATSSAACATGDMQVDASYIYVCTATNTWKRAALATF